MQREKKQHDAYVATLSFGRPALIRCTITGRAGHKKIPVCMSAKSKQTPRNMATFDGPLSGITVLLVGAWAVMNNACKSGPHA